MDDSHSVAETPMNAVLMKYMNDFILRHRMFDRLRNRIAVVDPLAARLFLLGLGRPPHCQLNQSIRMILAFEYRRYRCSSAVSSRLAWPETMVSMAN